MGQSLFGSAAVLPCSGGVGDQPAALMDAFDILDALIAESEPGAD